MSTSQQLLGPVTSFGHALDPCHSSWHNCGSPESFSTLVFLSSPYKAQPPPGQHHPTGASLVLCLPFKLTGHFQSKHEPRGFSITPILPLSPRHLLRCYPPSPPAPSQVRTAYHQHMGVSGSLFFITKGATGASRLSWDGLQAQKAP